MVTPPSVAGGVKMARGVMTKHSKHRRGSDFHRNVDKTVLSKEEEAIHERMHAREKGQIFFFCVFFF